MRKGNARFPKSSSWPRTKTVLKKWLNLKNEEFHSDCCIKESFGQERQERRKSCSDKHGSLLTGRDLSGGWLVESSENLRTPARYGSHPPCSSCQPPKELMMFVGTWNVGGRAPHQGLDMSSWLPDQQPASSPAHIYVLGFQEIVPLNAGNVLGAEDKGPAYKWLDLIRQALNPSSERSHSFPENHQRATIANPGLLKNENINLARLPVIEDILSMISELDDDSEPSTSNPESSSEEEIGDVATHRRSAGHGYRLAASKQMVGILLCVWIRADLMPCITSLRVSCVGRGIMGRMGNKGSISISLTMQGGTTMCFVCTHLASGEKDGDEVRRNSDVVEILKRTRFMRRPHHRLLAPATVPSPETILEHDKIIWLGDLNYRLTGRSCGDTQELLDRKDWQALLEKDQLRVEQRAGRVFGGWEEGRISFPPTYKYLADSDTYAAVTSSSAKSHRDKKRTPAWCDRILWRGSGMEQLRYARGESRFSDHRPVNSLFSVRLAGGKADLLLLLWSRGAQAGAAAAGIGLRSSRF